MTSAVLSAVQTLAANLKKDELAQLQPLADTYLSNVIASKSLTNDATQTAAFEAQVIAAVPNLETTAITDTATALKSLLDLEAGVALAAS